MCTTTKCQKNGITHLWWPRMTQMYAPQQKNLHGLVVARKVNKHPDVVQIQCFEPWKKEMRSEMRRWRK